MALILLIVVGGVLGWLASIVTRSDDPQGLSLNVAVGIAGALLSGLAANSGPILAGLSATALLVAIAGSTAFLALVNLIRSRQPG